MVLTDSAAVLAALEESALLPHPSADPSTGSTMRLRAAMARFSGPDHHPDRHDAVLEAIAKIVPTETLGTALGLRGSLDELIADVEAVVRVIGRAEPATTEADAATDRLLDRCADLAAGAVPTASLRYQNLDATAACWIGRHHRDRHRWLPIWRRTSPVPWPAHGRADRRRRRRRDR